MAECGTTASAIACPVRSSSRPSRRVAEPDRDLVRDGYRRDEIRARPTLGLGQGQERRDRVARMERLERQVRVVVIETPDRGRVREPRYLGLRAIRGAPYDGAVR